MGVDALGLTDDVPPPDEYGNDRTPPHDAAAEQSVVGAMLLDERVIDDVLDEMDKGDFYLPALETIAGVIVSMYRRGKPIDVISVGDELTKQGELTKVGGVEYLHTLTAFVPTAANAGYYASIVAAKAQLRRLVEAGTRITNMGYDSEGEIESLAASATREIADATSRRRVKLRSIGDGMNDLIDNLGEAPDYVPTGWVDLDELIGGVAPGELMVWAARPGDGKSVALLQLAAKFARTNLVSFTSLEMNHQDLQKRLLAQFGEVHLTRMRQHNLNKQDWDRIARARAATIEAPIFINFDTDASVETIRAHARSVARRGKLAGIFVDYLQIVKGGTGDARENRDSVIGQIVKGLRDIGQELEAPVIVAAQLNRGGGEKGPRGKYQLPTMANLRESGWIEQVADLIVLMSRDRDNPKKAHEQNLVVAKNRAGRHGRVDLLWQGEFGRLANMNLASSYGLFPRADLD